MAVAEQQKIALVIYSLQRAGAEKVVSVLSQQFARMGHQPELIVFDGRTIEYPYAGRLVDLKLPSQKHAGFLRKVVTLSRRMLALRRLYRRRRYDKIIAVMESAAFPSILTGYPIIVSNHCHPAIYFNRLEWLLARFLYPRAKKVVMVSQDSTACLRQRLSLKNLACIYNPVNFSALQESVAEPPAIKIAGDYIIALGRLEPQKRLDRLVTAYAASELKKSMRLLILGEGSLRAELQQQITNLRLTDRVLMPGNVSNPFPNVAAAHFTVLSSDHEGFPMVLIEALALGKPVISTDCDTGPREIIRPKVNGMLVPVDDVSALTTALDELHSNTQQYRTFCAQANASVQHLAVLPVAQQWLAL